MTKTFRMAVRALVACAFVTLVASATFAGTIIKLNLADIGPDVGMNGAGILNTINDGNAATAGDQHTAVEFTGFLDFIPDVPPSIGSFSMHNLVEVGPANVFGSLV